MLNPGMVLQDRYRITGTLGRGGMGAVYEATDLRFGSVVALKETLVSGVELDKAFEREAKLLNKLRHAALPVVFDYFANGQGQFLVMQHIPGDDLAALLDKNGGPFPQEVVIHWAEQLLDVLDYLHTQKPPIIHRDIKPHNLKLTPRGELILLDFGLSKTSAVGATKATTSVSLLGYTPQYASFEQINASGTDARSDLYSLAATLYHLLTASPPVDALTRAQQVMNGMADPLPRANEINAAVSEQVANALSAAMSMNREQRPINARTLRALLCKEDGSPCFANTVGGATITVDLPTHMRGQTEPRAPEEASEQKASHTDPTAAQVTSSTQPRSRGALALKGGLALVVVLLIVAGAFLWRNMRASTRPSTTVGPPIETPAAPGTRAPVPGENSFRFTTVQLDANGKVVAQEVKEARFFTEDLGNGASLDMVAMPAGRYLMGAPETEAKQYPDESPQHEVTLPRFYLSKFEVTQAEWRAVAALPKVNRDLNPEPARFKGDELPVESISWDEASEFCARLSKKSGRAYQLPSESEWEYAARAGSLKAFTFGETVTADLVNLDGTAPYELAAVGVFRQQTVPVGSLGIANAFGLYDIHGNVWEWCAGEYHANYEGAPTDGSARQSNAEVKYRVLRGGGWDSLGVDCRSASRLSYAQAGKRPNIGFRVAMSL